MTNNRSQVSERLYPKHDQVISTKKDNVGGVSQTNDLNRNESIEVSSKGPIYDENGNDSNNSNHVDDLLVGFDSDRKNRSKEISNENLNIENNKENKKTDTNYIRNDKKEKIDETLRPSLEPYFGRLEKFELFSTHQAYYLVGCDKHKNSYRFLRMDRTLIEHPPPRRAFNNYDTYYNSIHRTPSSYHSSDNQSHSFHDASQSKPISHSSTSTPTPTDDQSSSFQESMSNNVVINNNYNGARNIHSDNNLQHQHQHQHQHQQQHQSQIHSNPSISSSLPDPRHPNNPNGGYYPRVNHPHLNHPIIPQVQMPPPTSSYMSNHNYPNYQYANQQSYGHHSQYGQHHQHQHSHFNSPQKSSYRRLPDFCIEDPYVYSEEEIQQVLDMIHDGNKHVGGLRPIVKAYGIVGFITFLDCYYLTLITKRTKVGQIGSNGIYSIKVNFFSIIMDILSTFPICKL